MEGEFVLPLAEESATLTYEDKSMHQFLERGQRWKRTPNLVAVAALALSSASVVVCSRWTSAVAPPKEEAVANQIISLAPSCGRVIKEWQADGGKSRNPKKEHEPREMDVDSATAVVRCCPASGSGKGMTPEPCSGNVTWKEALDLCCQQPGDYRLCTKDELDADVAEGSGCEYDKNLVWTRRSSSTYWQSYGQDSVCRLDMSDQCCDGQGTAEIDFSTDHSSCEEQCRTRDDCTGYETQSDVNYCEIWTKPITHCEVLQVTSEVHECKRKVGQCPAKEPVEPIGA